MQNKLTFRFGALLLVFSFILGMTQSQAQYRTTLWEKSAKLSTKPLWMGTDTERGSAYGNGKLYVVARKVATNIYTVNPNTADSTGYLNMTGVSGGTIVLNDVEVSGDGAIYACNVTSNALTTTFKIYRWANDAAAPVEVINYSASAQRLGDKFTVVGSAADNTLTIYAPASTNANSVASNVVFRWRTTDNGTSFVRDSIALTGVSTTAPGASAAIYPLTTGVSEFVWKANGTQARRFNADGTVIDSLNSTLLPTGSNAMVYFSEGGRKYVLAYVYTGTPQNGLRLIDVTNQYNTQHVVRDFTPSIGTTTNTNGTGDVDLVSQGSGVYTAYMLATNNGLSAYNYYFSGLPDVNTVSSFPYTVDFANGLITDGGWSGSFIGRGTESRTNYAASFLYNYIPAPATQAERVPGLLVSPKIQLPANHRVRFWWKDDDITAIIGNDTTYFEVSTNNGSTWTTLGFMSRSASMSSYEEAIFDLSAYAGNNFRMRWRDVTNASLSAYGFGLDDILIEAIPQIPVIALNPSTTAFGATYIGGNMQKTVVVSNTGGAALTATLSLPSRVTANTTSLNIPNGQQFNLVLTFTPTDTSALNDSIKFVTNDPVAGTFYYKVSGTSVQPFILPTIVQNFDTSTGTIPANWSGTYAVNSTGGVNWSKRLTRNLYGSALTGNFATPFFSAIATSQLKFKYRVVNYTGYGTSSAVGTPNTDFKIFVSVSTNFGGSFSVVDSIGAHNHVADTNYVEKSWNLSAFAGKTIQVRIDGARLNGDFYSDFDDWFMGTPSETAIDWGNLQWPATATITAGDSVTAYGQAYKGGVTDSTGQAFGLNAWVGISTTNNNPANWTTWVPATFNVQSGNNDEFMASFGKNLAPGTYYYAFRYQYLGGPYRYGAYSTNGGGFWDSTNYKSGVLTVNPYSISSLPYFEGFEGTAFPPTGWVREDKNGGTTWTRATAQPRTGVGHARYTYSGTLPGNDFIITPGLQMTEGQAIQVTYWYKAQSGYPEKLKVLAGRAQTGDSLTTVLADHPNITNTTYADNTVFFIAPANGTYYFGFQAYTPADQYLLDLDDITISALKPVDYSMVSFNQSSGTPAEKTGAIKISKKNPEMTISFDGIGKPSSDVNNSKMLFSEIPTTDLAGLLPVYLNATVKRLGSTGPAFTVGANFNGNLATPVNRPGIGTIGGTDLIPFNFTATARGTFTARAFVSAVGDSVSNNDTLANFKVRVYPDSGIVVKNDDYENNAITSVGFGTNNLPMTAGVRFTAGQNMRLANIDAIYRNEASADSIVVKVWAAGVDTLAPGAVLYTKSFAGENYINPGAGPQLVTLPLDNNAPTFLAGSDFWVSISFVSTIQFPMGAHAGTIPKPGRSYGSSDGGTTWFPLVLSSVPYAWTMRAIGIPYTPPPPPVYSTVWEKSQAQGSLPSWFSTANNERGFAYGRVNDGTGNMVNRLFVVSRNGGNFVRVVDAATGSDAGTLTMDAIISGGLITINDIEVTYDGKILATNVVGSTVTAQDWKVYMWDNLTSTPVLAMTYVVPPVNPNTRLGDKFRVTGNFYNNTAVIWAADAANAKVYKFSMSNGAFNPVPEIITLSNGAFGGSASVAPLPDGSFYYNAAGKNVMKYTSTGTIIDTLPGTVVATGSNSIQYLGSVNRAFDEYVLTFAYGAGNENGFMAKIPNGAPKQGSFYGKTVTLGTNSNANGTGDVAFMFNDDNTITVFVLSSNNGFGAYKLVNIVPVELTSFTATSAGSNVNLAWTTATETNSMEFVVERKAAGRNWENAGSVKAAGTSTSAVSYTFTDKNVATGKYSYRLRQIDLDGTSATFNAVEVEVGVPNVFDLSQNYPNPFNPSTRVNFSLPTPENVTLEVFDISGQKVATILSGMFAAGYHSADIDAQKLQLSSGIYIYKLSAGKFTSVKKMMLMK